MAINGINSTNSWGYYIRYQQSINNTRLTQALSKNPKISSYLQGTSSTSANTASKNFVQSYNSHMSDLMSAANALKTSNSSGVFHEITASSSDTSIADVKKNYTIREAADYDLNVSQIATAQTNSSEFVSGSALASEDMNFSIETGNGKIDVNVSAVKENGGKKTNYQMMKEAANIINSKKGDVTASVELNKDGKASLKISANETGSKNTFTISGNEGAAAGIKEVAEEGKDAIYSVTKDGVTKDYVSSSNKVSLDLGRMTATLKNTGNVTISAGVSNDKVVSAVKDLVSKYNKALDFLNENADRGSGVTKQIANMSNNVASERSMNLVGITVKSDGTMEVDEEKLMESLNKDPSLTRDILGGSFGVAQGAFNDAVKGLSMNSVSLIDNDLASQQSNSYSNSISMTSLLTGNNALRLNNISALGLMLDMFA